MKAAYFAFCAILATGASPACATTSEIAAGQRAMEVKDKALYGGEDQAYAAGRDFGEFEIPNIDLKDLDGVFVYTRKIAAEFLGDSNYKREGTPADPYHTRKGTVESIADLLNYVLIGNTGNPNQEELSKAYWIAEDLRAKGKVNFDKKNILPNNAVGAYTYKPGVEEADDETIGIYFNKNVKHEVCMKLGDRPCAAILAHEACHAKARRERVLNPHDVIANEVYAFQCEYAYLKMAYPDQDIYGNSFQFSWLEDHVLVAPKRDPNAEQYSDLAVNFMIHLGKLWQTGGDAARIRQFVEETGYRDPQPS